MKILVLAFRMIKKRIIGLALVSAEMILSVIVLLAILSKIEYTVKCREAAYSIVADGNYCFSAFNCYFFQKDFDIARIIPEKYKGKISFGTSTEADVGTLDGRMRVIVYSDMILEGLQISDAFSTQKIDGGIPAVAFGDYYEAGNIIETESGTDIYIVKNLGEISYLPYYAGTSSANILTLDKYVKKVRGNGIILRAEENNLFQNVERTDSLIFNMDALDNDEKKKFIEFLEGYGQVVSVDRMKENYLRETKIDLLSHFFLFIVFAVTVTIGVYGTNCMWAEKNKRMYSIMYITGMSRKTNVFLEIIVTVSVFIGTYILIFGLYDNIITSFIPYDISENKTLYCFMILTYFMTVYLISSFETVRNASKHNLIDLYKRNTNEN